MGINETELPSIPMERVSMVESILIDCATGGSSQNDIYEHLRREFVQNEEFKPLLPAFVRTHRNLTSFWGWIKHQVGTYAERRQIIAAGFTPLMDHLEGKGSAPGDKLVSEALETFDAEGVHAVWNKALARRSSDPEGAITIARTLLETVCKRILDECSISYTDKEDLPKLYQMAAKALNLAPDQHSEEPIKAILGGAMNLVNGIGTLRNRLSDSHGRGGRLPVKPSARHASLAVNTAGAVAMFLVETYVERHIRLNAA
ncbi:abortive infection family protein [Mesorhizobium sp.]|uniref:abortive infection family protein n=1 Tax=Mesorhizobium sp. TaxID=1871066 RepID=UPI0025E62302|nr:abortive infection family protein [Mesorhizobium sp.]